MKPCHLSYDDRIAAPAWLFGYAAVQKVCRTSSQEVRAVSEYQYVEFRAIDRPLAAAEMSYAAEQSSHAEISRWSFRSEYHYGDFRGDVQGLLRHGYDVHLYYANFGVRTAAFRLPAGLPFSKTLWSRYIGTGELKWEQDRKGKAGILWLSPYREEIDEIWDPGEYMENLVDFRRRLVTGDLRTLYVLWLCAAMDDQSVEPNVVEPPVPGGLAECPETWGPFLEFFGLDPLMLVAAAEGSPESPKRLRHAQQCQEWVEQRSESEAKRWLDRLLTEDANAVKAELVATIGQLRGSFVWPMASLERPLQLLLDRAAQLRADEAAQEQKQRAAAAKREAAKKERARQDRMKEMVKQPHTWLRESTKLVDARGIANYRAAAEILADLREVLASDEGDKIVRKHAAQLAKQHPTLGQLKSSLRKRGLLD